MKTPDLWGADLWGNLRTRKKKWPLIIVLTFMWSRKNFLNTMCYKHNFKKKIEFILWNKLTILFHDRHFFNNWWGYRWLFQYYKQYCLKKGPFWKTFYELPNFKIALLRRNNTLNIILIIVLEDCASPIFTSHNYNGMVFSVCKNVFTKVKCKNERVEHFTESK